MRIAAAALFAAALVFFCSGAFGRARAADPRPAPAAVIRTTHGSFEVELFPNAAPETVRLFLARAAGAAAVAPYAGTQVCESRGSAYLVFGCTPFENAGPKPKAAGLGPAQRHEIDARAMGLDAQRLTDEKEIQALWQLEIAPRYTQLRERGKPVPAGLERLMADVRERGSAATSALRGRSRLWYLEALGFGYEKGRSPHRVTRGALATYTLWPDEIDERFLVALADVSERDGRATVFGRVVSGWDTLAKIENIPVDKARRPRERVRIVSIEEPGTKEPS